MSASARATALVAAGRHTEARSVAEAALEAEGPEPALFLALARGHMAEDDDDHDDEAERVFRRALDVFPDHVDLLAGYAELCLRSDALDRPGRHGRGPVLLERLRELAPDSPQLRRAVESTSVLASATAKGPSAARVQCHDVVHALATSASPRAAEEEARQRAALTPYDQRLAVLDETLTVLARPGRAPLRLLVRRTPEYLFVAQLALAVLLVTRHAVGPFPLWVLCVVGVLLNLPLLVLRLLLRGARTRGRARAEASAVDGAELTGAKLTGAELAGAEPTGAEPSSAELTGAELAGAEPSLPDVPRFAPRELAIKGAGAAVALTALATTGILTYSEYTAYPRYEAVAPYSFRGMARMDMSEFLDVAATSDPGREVEAAFAYHYTGGAGDGSELAVTGTIGDFHDATSALVYGSDSLLASVPGVTSRQDTWVAEPGSYGGWMQCSRYVEDITGTPRAICFWADKGSMGSVSFKAADMPRPDVEQLARMTRQSVTRPLPSAS